MTNGAKKTENGNCFFACMTMALGYWVELITLLSQPQSCGRTLYWNPTHSQPYTEVKERDEEAGKASVRQTVVSNSDSGRFAAPGPKYSITHGMATSQGQETRSRVFYVGYVLGEEKWFRLTKVVSMLTCLEIID